MAKVTPIGGQFQPFFEDAHEDFWEMWWKCGDRLEWRLNNDG
jgi:hypothetical protein